MVTSADRGCACAHQCGLAAISNSPPFPYICRPTVSLSWTDPKPEYLQQNLISTNLFITLPWAKFRGFFFPFKDMNQKMCKRVGSTSPHTLHSKSQGKRSLCFVHKRVWKHAIISIAWNLSLTFSPLQSTPRRYSIKHSHNMKLSKQVKLSTMAWSFSSKFMTL